MNATIQLDVVRRLVRDFEFKEREKYLQQGVCPCCQKRELFTSIEKPWILKCGRENKCAHEISVKEIYPDIFDDWSSRYQTTPEAPHAAAEAYLRESRGLDTSRLAGAYVQSTFIKNGFGSATVRFTLANGSHWERIIDQPERFSQKANFLGGYAGYWWEYPGLDLTAQKEIWITEGIFNAIALNEAGKVAVATLSSVNYPKALLDTLAEKIGDKPRPRLIWAFDDDRAGRSHIVKFARRAQDAGWEVSAALPSEHGSTLDWNDLHLRERMEPKNLNQYRHYGRLLLASSPAAKAMELWNHNQRHCFHFVFGNRTYWFDLDFEKYSKALSRIQETEGVFDDDKVTERALRESNGLVEIASCVLKPLYFLESKPTDESWYYLKVSTPDGEMVKSTFTAAQIASAPEFKKRLLHVAKGALYTGSTKELNRLVASFEGIPKVKTMDFIGYNKDYRAWIFNDIAVFNGRLFPINNEDYFQLDSGSVKSLSLSPCLKLNDNFSEFDRSWIDDVWTAYGVKGYVALAFWFASYFAEQVRERNKSFPIMEISGEYGTGKTTLIEFLWKLSGREDYEGIDPSKASPAARGRSFVQVANMPVVLMEGDREDNGKPSKYKAFDFNELKTLYNGRPPRALGVKASNNETYEPLFRGSVLIAQNDMLRVSEPVMSRMISMYTDKSGHSARGLEAGERLEKMPVRRVSGFMLMATLKEKEIMGKYDALFEQSRNAFAERGAITVQRIIKCHSQIMAFLSLLQEVIPVPDERIEQTREYFFQLAMERQNAIQTDSAVIREFWDVVEYLDGREEFGVNHSDAENIWAINFNHIEEVASLYRQNFSMPLSDIKDHLRAGKSYKFIDVKPVRSFISKQANSRKTYGKKMKEVYKCWVFEKVRGVHPQTDPDDD